jgi:acetyl esterase
MTQISKLAPLLMGAALAGHPAMAEDIANDPHLDPQVRAFLVKLNKDSSPFWELPQPKPQEILTGLQNQTPVDMSGVSTTEKTVTEDGRTVKIYIMKPEHAAPKPGVLLFIHGGVWIVGNFANHQRLLRDLVVGSGQVGVFVEYTPLPQAKFPTQLEETYAALKWVAAHAGAFGADGSRIAVAGNSVGGNMAAAVSIMAKDRNGPKIRYQALLIPATDASVDTDSYHAYATGRFLARAFMEYGWNLYAPDAEMRDNPYVSPLRASQAELKDLPPALVVTAENDPLRDEGEAYAARLTDAGVTVTHTRFAGQIHAFWQMPGLFPAALQAADLAAADLKAAFGTA